MQKIGLKRDLRCINPCKCGDGSYLKKLTSSPKRGGRSGNFRGSKNQKFGKCHELSRQSIQFVSFNPSHPGGFRGEVGGQKSGKFHELSRKSIKKIPPPPPKGVAVGILVGQKNQKSGKCHELARKVIKKINPTPPHQQICPPGVGSFKG